jgi:hypothetical protein
MPSKAPLYFQRLAVAELNRRFEGEWYSLPFLIIEGYPSHNYLRNFLRFKSSVFCANVYRCTIFNNFVFVGLGFLPSNDCSPSLLRCVREGLVQNRIPDIYWPLISENISRLQSKFVYVSLWVLGSSGHSLDSCQNLTCGWDSISSRNSSKCRHQTI